MPNYYYIKNGGTAVGTSADASATYGIANTQLTSAWSVTASEYFDSIADALAATTTPVDGDIFCCSDVHNFEYGATTTITLTPSIQLHIISVSNSNRDQYSAGAKETCGTTNMNRSLAFSQLTGSTIVQGVSFEAGRNIVVNTTKCRIIFKDLSFTTYRLSDEASNPKVSGLCYITFENVTFNTPTSTSARYYVYAYYGVFVEFINCTVTGNFVYYGYWLATANDRTATVVMDGVDLSGATSLSYLFGNTDINEGFRSFDCHNILLPSGASINDPTNVLNSSTFRINASGAAGEYYGQETATYLGAMAVDTTTKLNGTYDGTNAFSWQVDATSNCNYLALYLVKVYESSNIDLSAAKTVTVLATAEASLKDTEIGIMVLHTSTTDEVLLARKTTAPTELFSGGTAITAGNTDPGWTSPAAETYELTVDMGAQAGITNGTVKVFLWVGKTSLTANFDMPTIAAT